MTIDPVAGIPPRLWTEAPELLGPSNICREPASVPHPSLPLPDRGPIFESTKSPGSVAERTRFGQRQGEHPLRRQAPWRAAPDTRVAVALWENGVRHLSHSPKYGRPRGVTCARGHCTACLMRVDGIPNVRICETARARGHGDRAAGRRRLLRRRPCRRCCRRASLFPVGFYYKWFTRPPFVSRFFLDSIRPMTGIGRLPESQFVHCELLPPVPCAELDRVRHRGRGCRTRRTERRDRSHPAVSCWSMTTRARRPALRRPCGIWPLNRTAS